MASVMADKKKLKLLIVSIVTLVVTIALTITRSIIMVIGFNSNSMQYSMDVAPFTHVVIIACAVLAVLIILSYFLIKNYEIASFSISTPLKASTGVLFIIVGVLNAVSVLSKNVGSYSSSSTYAAYRLILIICTVFAVASGIYLLFTIKEKKKNLNIISSVLPLWAAMSILASYFNPDYTHTDTNRMVYCLMLIGSAIMFVKASKNMVYETNNYLSSILGSLLSLAFSIIFLVPNVVYMLSAGKSMTLFGVDNLVAIAIILFSTGVILQALKKDTALD